MEPAEATRKRVRLRRRREGGGEPDRLSALPDCLLHVIMSSLKARQAVQTCVLSRRWRHLWRSVPCLDVDLDEFRAEAVAESEPAFNGGGHDVGSGGSGVDTSDCSADTSGSDDSSSGSDIDISDSENDYSSDSDLDSSDSSSSSSSSEDDDDDDGNKDKEWEKFEDFAANLMVRCNIAQLESFRMHIRRHRAPRIASRIAAGWLRRAMKYCTPDPPGQCKGLNSCSWRLKRLHLYHLPLDNRFAKHVSSMCRSLEDLELHGCSCKIQSVTSHSLKILVLKNCRWYNLSEITSPTLKKLIIDGGSNSNDCTLVIMAPSVTYLHLAVKVHCFWGGISTNEMPSIAKASIHLQGHRDSMFSSKLEDDQSELLSSVSTVTSLELSGVGTTVLGNKPRFQEFLNLRNLLLGNCDLSDDFRTLGFFLQSSPNLEKLALRCCKFPKYSKRKRARNKLNKTSSSELRGLDFMCKNLRVEIIYKDGNARQLVKLLLGASGNLSKSRIKLTKV